MNKKILCIILAVSFMQLSFSQNDDKKIFVKPGIGFGYGLFYPTEINNYIDNDLSDYITFNKNLYLNVFIRGSLGVQLNDQFVIEPVLEVAVAPKFITGIDKTYIFGRISPGIIANFHVPVGHRRNSIYLGAGALYHHMWFEDYSGSAIGPAFQGGISLNFGKSFNPEAFAGLNFARAIGSYNGSLTEMEYGPELELSCTDFHMGFRVNFKL